MIIRRSTNQFSKLTITIGTNGWEGGNLVGELFGFKPFGIGEFGGISHFKNVSNYTINHNG